MYGEIQTAIKNAFCLIHSFINNFIGFKNGSIIDWFGLSQDTTNWTCFEKLQILNLKNCPMLSAYFPIHTMLLELLVVWGGWCMVECPHMVDLERMTNASVELELQFLAPAIRVQLQWAPKPMQKSRKRSSFLNNLFISLFDLLRTADSNWTDVSIPFTGLYSNRTCHGTTRFK